MKVWIAATALLLAVGCAPKAFPEDTLPAWEERPVTGTFNADFDTVWDATLAVMGEHADLDKIERNTGRILTDWVFDSSDYIYKTYGGTRVPEPIRWRMSVGVTRISGRTEVQMINQEQVEKDLISANLEFTGSIYKWIDVPSSTSKERMLLEEILERLEQKRAQPEYDYDYAQ